MVIVIAIAFHFASMCSSTCVVMSIRSAIGVLCGWQTFAFSIAHALLFEFFLSVRLKLCSTERRYVLCSKNLLLLQESCWLLLRRCLTSLTMPRRTFETLYLLESRDRMVAGENYLPVSAIFRSFVMVP